MANCLITEGIGIDCNDKRRSGGLKPKFWLANLSEFATAIDTETAGYITSLSFDTYKGLHAYEGAKFSHSAAESLQVAEGGNKSFNHTITAKLFNNSPTDDATLEDLAVADVVAIVETNNREFLIYGGSNGLEMTAYEKNTGTNATADTTAQITLTGNETRLPKRFFVTDYATTKALLEGYEV